MARNGFLLSGLFIILATIGCGSSSTTGGGGTGGGGSSTNAPVITGMAPSSLLVGSPATTLIIFGSNFVEGVTINWNGTPLTSVTCVGANLTTYTICPSASAIIATLPANDLASTGSASITVSNPNPDGGTSRALPFSIVAPSAGNTWARSIPGVTAPQDIVWDAAHSTLYASVSSTDPASPNALLAINPVTAAVTSSLTTNSNPDLLTISSDASYLWVGLDGSNTVQRYNLPALTPDISFPIPAAGSLPQVAVALQAAPSAPHTLGMIAGNWGYSPTGNGVYIYDDATQRPNHVGGGVGYAMIDYFQWGATNSVLYGDQYTTIDAGGIATMSVTPAGVSLTSYLGNGINPTITQFDPNNGLLYSYGGADDPVRLTQVGQFSYPLDGPSACTADSSTNRYFCIVSTPAGDTDVSVTELFVFDLTSYALVNEFYFGSTAGNSSSSIPGRPTHLVRWGNAGLAVTTITGPYNGTGGIFLIDGAAVNPTATPDATSGTSPSSYATLSSILPESAPATSTNVSVTINGSNFTPDSTACWNCSAIQLQLLPTTYVSPTQLNVTIPVAAVSSTEPLEISVYDAGASIFSTNALTFTLLPATGTTKVTPINLCGLAAAWDPTSQLLYVGTADYDPAYPNSVVAINPQTGTVTASQLVSPDPIFLSEGAQDKYLYVAYDGATNLTQLALPSLTIASTAVLNNPQDGPWLPGDMKAAPVSPDTAAVTFTKPGWTPEALGGVVIFDNGVERPGFAPGWTGGQTVPALYDTLAWSSSDDLLASAPNENAGPLLQLQVNSAGVSYLGQGTADFNSSGDEIHSDFGTGLIYSDNGNVANPTTGAIVGSYGASGLVAPDSTTGLVFILGQTAAQSGSYNYTIQSFNQTTFALVSSISVNLSGAPIELVRWGSSGLAIPTVGGIGVYADGLGMTYLLQDSAFVSAPKLSALPSDRPSTASKPELVQMRWNQHSKRDWLKLERKAAQAQRAQ